MEDNKEIKQEEIKQEEIIQIKTNMSSQTSLQSINDTGLTKKNIPQYESSYSIKDKLHNINTEENILNELENIRINQDLELRKKVLELQYKRRLEQMIDSEDIEKIYYELESGRRKNDLKNQIDLTKINENIELYPLDEYNKSCCSLINFFRNQNVIDDFDKIYKIIISLPSINNYEKNLILLRFSNIQAYCLRKYNRISKLYSMSQIFLIACSIINPALLSINIDRTNSFYNIIFWTVWVLQLLVSLITGYVSLYKWDKKNFLFNIYKTKINQEIWFFIGLTGKNYNNVSGNYSHSEHVNTFLNRLEKIYTMLKTTEFEMENTKDSDGSSNSNISKQVEIFQSRVAQQPQTQVRY